MTQVSTLKAQTRYRSLIYQLDDDVVLLNELANELSRACREHRVTRLNLLRSGGRVAIDRRDCIQRIMEKRIGRRLDWRVICVGVNQYEKGNAFSKALAAIFGTMPVTWIRISF